MTNKKVLIEAIGPISYIVGEIHQEPFTSSLEYINGVAWNVPVNQSVKCSKNLTNKEKEELNLLLFDLSNAFLELRNGISLSKLDELGFAFDDVTKFCEDNNIEIIDEYAAEDWNDNESDDKAKNES